MSGPKILVLDIETAPLLGYAWGVRKTFIDPVFGIKEHPRMLCFGSKWHGEPHRNIEFFSEYHDGRGAMLDALHERVDEADFIAGWNSKRFDRTWVNAELDKEGYSLPSPSKDIDLMRVALKNLRLPSYKLDYVARHHYGLPGKVSHQGFTLWMDVLSDDPKKVEAAWKVMRRYQIGDIRTTDDVLKRMKPMVTTLPALALYDENGEPVSCGCGSKRLQRRGWAYTNQSRYRRYQCQGCGVWLRGTKRDYGVELLRLPSAA